MTDVGQHGFSGATGFINDAASGLVTTAWSGGNPGYVEVGMTTCAGATSHLYQSNSRGRKGRWGGFFAEFPLKNTGLFGFYVCNTQLEFPSAEHERVSKPPASQERIQTNIERKLRDKE